MRPTPLLTVLLLTTPALAAAPPCLAIPLSPERKTTLAAPIVAQLRAYQKTIAPDATPDTLVTQVEIRSAYQSGPWSILYVEPDQLDPVYLFYAADPATSRYVYLFGGSAPASEQPAIMQTILKAVPNLPRPLAACIASTITS